MAAPGNAQRNLVTDHYDSKTFSNDDDPNSIHPGDPSLILQYLAPAVIEVLAGVRDLDQISRWLCDEVYLQMRQHVAKSASVRSDRAKTTLRPSVDLGKMTYFSPARGVIEAVVIVHLANRARAVAIRLEGFHGRWRAKSLAVL